MKGQLDGFPLSLTDVLKGMSFRLATTILSGRVLCNNVIENR